MYSLGHVWNNASVLCQCPPVAIKALTSRVDLTLSSLLQLVPLAYDIILCGLFLFRAYQLRKEFPQAGMSQRELGTSTDNFTIFLAIAKCR